MKNQILHLSRVFLYILIGFLIVGYQSSSADGLFSGDTRIKTAGKTTLIQNIQVFDQVLINSNLALTRNDEQADADEKAIDITWQIAHFNSGKGIEAWIAKPEDYFMRQGISKDIVGKLLEKSALSEEFPIEFQETALELASLENMGLSTIEEDEGPNLDNTDNNLQTVIAKYKLNSIDIKEYTFTFKEAGGTSEETDNKVTVKCTPGVGIYDDSQQHFVSISNFKVGESFSQGGRIFTLLDESVNLKTDAYNIAVKSQHHFFIVIPTNSGENIELLVHNPVKDHKLERQCTQKDQEKYRRNSQEEKRKAKEAKAAEEKKAAAAKAKIKAEKKAAEKK